MKGIAERRASDETYIIAVHSVIIGGDEKQAGFDLIVFAA